MKTRLFITTFFLFAFGFVANAYDFMVDGLCYNRTGTNTVEVTYERASTERYSSLSGDLEILESINYNGTTYSVISIGDCAFSGCSGLTSVSIPNSVTSIGDCAFSYCSGLTSVSIPNSVTSISDRAFYGCSGLTSVTIPNSVTSIGRDAFSGCSGLTSVAIGSSVTSIGKGAFCACDDLESIIVDNGNPKYDSRNNCNAIIDKKRNTLITGCKTTIIPNSVTTIGERAFFDCRGLTSINIPNSVTIIRGQAFTGCDGLTSLTIGNSVSQIIDYAFSNCTSLTEVTIPNSVYAIGCSVFSNCGLTNVTIGKSVQSIGNNAFEYCFYLTEIWSKIVDIDGMAIGYNVFNYVPTSTCVLKVPVGTSDKYKNAYAWKAFSHIVEYSSLGDVNADGEVDGIDLNTIINIVLGKDSGNYGGRADLVGDGEVNGNDINKLINLLLNKQ